MLKLKFLGAAAILAGAMTVAGLADAQGGNRQGAGKGAGQGAGMGATAGDMDQDRLRVMDPASRRDKLQDLDRDRLRDPDRDRRYLGTQDRLRKFDRDGDKRVNRTEFEDWHQDMFGQMDTDGNGLTLQEYHAARFGPGPYSDANPERQALMRQQANLRKTERYRVMDGNGDGIVSREEYMRFGEHAWLEADTNDDGQLSWGELQAYNRGM